MGQGVKGIPLNAQNRTRRDVRHLSKEAILRQGGRRGGERSGTQELGDEARRRRRTSTPIEAERRETAPRGRHLRK